MSTKALIEKTSHQRESGIELVKIIAIFLIVISHVCVSVGQKPHLLPELFPYLIDSSIATANIQHLIIAFFRHFGVLGNNIFLACSFWFLCDSKKFSLNKILVIILDVWVISVAYLLIYLCVGETISIPAMITCFLPTLFGNNWFITCYVLIYLLHPLLNLVIHNLTQKTHATLCLVLITFYWGLAFIKDDLLYYSSLIHFIVLYFVVSYIKKHMINWSNNLKNNILLLLFGLLGILGMLLITNFLGLRFGAFSNMLLKWNTNNNPFIVMTAIALFNIFRQLKFVNPFINYLSSCSLLVYLIHENILFCNFTRVRIWVRLLEFFGKDTILLQVLIYSIVLFILAYIVSILYQKTVHKITTSAGKLLEKLITMIFDSVTHLILKIN